MYTLRLLALILPSITTSVAKTTNAAEQIYYSGSKNCNPVSRSGGVTFTPGQCQVLTASGLGLGSLDSVNLTRTIEPNCAVFYYTNDACNPGAKGMYQSIGAVGKCVAGKTPFLSTKVICP